ncbi:MAG: tripartite tricarboxylate transporter substrate binding protein [Pseudomonadota bacterium]|nr:tripartite tricarboxylate transporter substrate binding protein [Pseudomonadota bacterium]
MTSSLTRRAALTLAVAGACACAPAWASGYPSKPVRIIVPYAPGGAVDVATRKMAQKLTEQTGRSFYVENRAGGTGTIGTLQAARAPGDGYTLLANDTTYSLLPHIFKKLPFNHDGDLVPVAAYVFAPMGLAVNASSRFKTLADLVAEGKAKPNTVTYGSGGPGTTPHFAAEALGIASGARLMHVPFKGAAEASQAVLSGTVDMQIASTTGLMSSVRGGKMRMLAVSGDKRIAALPDVPTFREAGVPWDGVLNFTGLWAPRGTPPAVLERLQKEIATAMTSADMKAFAEGMGAESRQIGSEAFARLLKDSTGAWGKVAAHTAFERQ